eukprot:6488803-Amphidinium_carterae.1
MEPTGRWKKDKRVAAMTVDEHKELASMIRARVLNRCRPAQDTEAKEMLAKITEEEVLHGYLDGPHTLEDAVSAFPDVTFAKRFMLRQKDKWRPIDDFTISSTNLCVSTEEKARVDTVDNFL